MNKIFFQRWRSPVGHLFLYSHDDALVALTFSRNDDYVRRHFKDGEIIERSNKVIDQTIAQLKEYFIGKRRKFDVKLRPLGTDFQKKVWQSLRAIPYGQTITYKDQASAVGFPKGLRAVGSANGKNPIGIIIPCHRVIGTSGALTGYAGGLDIKAQLLKLEGVLLT